MHIPKVGGDGSVHEGQRHHPHGLPNSERRFGSDRKLLEREEVRSASPLTQSVRFAKSIVSLWLSSYVCKVSRKRRLVQILVQILT